MEVAQRLHGLPLVINDDTKFLILGSFPGSESLRLHQYYAQPRNQFWRIMDGVFQTSLVNLVYEAKVATLLRMKIGLWDIYASCERKGSLDSKIRRPVLNDFDQLHAQFPSLAVLCFNGLKASSVAPGLRDHGFQCRAMESSSPAHAIGLPRKIHAWKYQLEDREAKSGDLISSENIMDAIRQGRREREQKDYRLFIKPLKKAKK